MLIAAKGASRVDRSILATLPVPDRTDTFTPVPHETLVQEIEGSLAFRHIHVTNQEFAVSEDGMKCFGLLEVNAEYEGVNFAIGFRNANDRSMRVGIVAGYRVTVCSNMMFAGDFNPMLAKHSKHLNLSEGVGIAVDRIQRNWEPLRREIDVKRNTLMDIEDSRLLIYKAFIRHKLPISLFKQVATTFEQFSPNHTMWDIEQLFTASFKNLNPISQYQATAKLPAALNRTEQVTL